MVRKCRVKKLKYKYIKVPLSPGELIEIDVKYVPEKLGNRRYFQFTAIDCATRWRYLEIYDDCTNYSSVKFLEKVLRIAPFRVCAIKTDNGSNFTNRYVGYLKSGDPVNPRLHDLDLVCQSKNIIHYLIDPGKPAQNGKVERSHRSDQEIFYDRHNFKNANDLKKRIRTWNEYYNNLEHCGLNGKTPNEMLELLTIQKPTNVCV